MSDADWDMEYDKAYDLENKIIEYCTENNINVPTFSEYARSWELEKIFIKLKGEDT